MSGTILDTLKVSRREKANDAAALLFPADSKSSGLKRLDIAISSPASGALSGAPQEPKEPAEYEQYREASIALGAGAEAAVLVRFVAAGAASQDRAADEPARMQDARLARAENPETPGSLRLTTSLHIRLAAHARLNLYVLSNLPASFSREALSHAALSEGAVLTWTNVVFDEGNGLYTTRIELEGEGSELDFAGAYGARCTTEGEHALSIHHTAPHSKSRTILKSALKDSAHLAFRGLIHVENTARGTDAYLANRNLVLEDGARAESFPQLKIETDDVACSHGATTGGPRQEELFYLMSRGLDRAAAKNMLVLGHLGSVLNRLPPDLAEKMEDIAASALGLDEQGSCI